MTGLTFTLNFPNNHFKLFFELWTNTTYGWLLTKNFTRGLFFLWGTLLHLGLLVRDQWRDLFEVVPIWNWHLLLLFYVFCQALRSSKTWTPQNPPPKKPATVVRFKSGLVLNFFKTISSTMWFSTLILIMLVIDWSIYSYVNKCLFHSILMVSQ